MTTTSPVTLNPAVKSKINWTQIIGALAMFGSYFGLNLDPELQAQVAVTVGGLSYIATWVFRTFWTG